jgi:hypothetical protein
MLWRAFLVLCGLFGLLTVYVFFLDSNANDRTSLSAFIVIPNSADASAVATPLVDPAAISTGTALAEATIVAAAHDPQNFATIEAVQQFRNDQLRRGDLGTPINRDILDEIQTVLAGQTSSVDTPTAGAQQPSVSATPTVVASSSPTSQQRVLEVSSPRKLPLDRTDSLIVSLVLTTAQVITSPKIEGNNITIFVTPVAVGTPGAPVERAFGNDYVVSAETTAYSLAFDLLPPPRQIQPLDTSRVTWVWNITPKKSGRQVVDLSIDLIWEKPGAEDIRRTIWTEQTAFEVTWISGYIIDQIKGLGIPAALGSLLLGLVVKKVKGVPGD